MTRIARALVALTLTASLACDKQAAEDDAPTENTTDTTAATETTAPAETSAPAEPEGDTDDPRLAACPGIDEVDTSSGDACTEMGCEDGFLFEIDEEVRKVAGEYVIKLDADGEVAECKGTLPTDSCDGSMVCDMPALLSTGIDGCGADAAAQRIGMFRGTALPPSFTLTVTRDGEQVFDQAYETSYATVQPNGEGCTPVCCQGKPEPAT